MAPHPLPDTAGASRRASRGDFQRRPRFRRECPAAILRSRLGSASPRFSAVERRRSPAFGIDPTVVSQRQGLLVDPGGARRRPECRSCVTCPQGHRTPSRLTTPHDAPLNTDEVGRSVGGPQQPGISPSPSYRRTPVSSSRATRVKEKTRPGFRWGGLLSCAFRAAGFRRAPERR